MKVLVCGGRNYGRVPNPIPPHEDGLSRQIIAKQERCTFETAMANVHACHKVTEVIHGGAPGADELARTWALRKSILVTMFPANWQREGKAAGPLRNQRMLDIGKPELVVAFPGGAGTADMVRRAHAAKVPVLEIPDATECTTTE